MAVNKETSNAKSARSQVNIFYTNSIQHLRNEDREEKILTDCGGQEEEGFFMPYVTEQRMRGRQTFEFSNDDILLDPLLMIPTFKEADGCYDSGRDISSVIQTDHERTTTWVLEKIHNNREDRLKS